MCTQAQCCGQYQVDRSGNIAVAQSSKKARVPNLLL